MCCGHSAWKTMEEDPKNLSCVCLHCTSRFRKPTSVYTFPAHLQRPSMFQASLVPHSVTIWHHYYVRNQSCWLKVDLILRTQAWDKSLFQHAMAILSAPFLTETGSKCASSFSSHCQAKERVGEVEEDLEVFLKFLQATSDSTHC